MHTQTSEYDVMINYCVCIVRPDPIYPVIHIYPMCVNIEMRPAPVSPRREVVNPVRPEREQR